MYALILFYYKIGIFIFYVYLCIASVGDMCITVMSCVKKIYKPIKFVEGNELRSVCEFIVEMNDRVIVMKY